MVEGGRFKHKIFSFKVEGENWVLFHCFDSKGGGGSIEDVNGVKDEVKRIFEDRYSEHCSRKPVMNASLFSILSSEDSMKLEEPFSLEEIRTAVWNCEGSKSSDPNGLNFEFIHKFWSLLEDDMVKFMNEFHLHAKLPKAITTSFTVLVPKVLHPHQSGDYKAICLVGCWYKIVQNSS